MSWTVKVDGADTFARTARRAAAELRDLSDANAKIAAGIARAANPPRRSGRLAASLTPSATASDAEVSSSLVYAGVIEGGWYAHGIEATRFLETAATGQQSPALDAYMAAVNDALAGVRGA